MHTVLGHQRIPDKSNVEPSVDRVTDKQNSNLGVETIVQLRTMEFGEYTHEDFHPLLVTYTRLNNTVAAIYERELTVYTL